MPTSQKRRAFETTFNLYTETGFLGEGGAGTVYKVTDEEGRTFALKILHSASTLQRKRFKNEIAFCSKKSSPHIVAVLDHGFTIVAEKTCPFYLMPLYAGTLRTLLKSGLQRDAALPYFSQILDGVEASHLQEVVHRDLKPENILHEPSSDMLVIADFGIARFTEEALFTAVETRAQDRLANFLYAAPEQRVRGGDVGLRADIYALGLILNEMFTGEVLQGTGHKQIGSVAPQYAYLDALVDRMVRHSPDDRPTSIAEIKRELIARGNEFVAQQKLSQLKNTVVPESEIEDPIFSDPIKPVGLDYAAGGLLVFELNRTPPSAWIQAFRSLPQYAAIIGCEPLAFQFLGNHSSVPVVGNQSSVMQMVADHFKNYVQATNENYKRELVETQQRSLENQRRALREQIQARESLQRMRESVKAIKL
jgi:serine/threonine protein kinase